MTFANEVKDFLAGYQTMTEIAGRKEERAQDKAYKDAIIEIQRAQQKLNEQEFELKKTAATSRAAIGGGRKLSKTEQEAKVYEDANTALNSTPSISPDQIADFSGMTGATYEQTFADGGVVEEEPPAVPARQKLGFSGQQSALPVDNFSAPAAAPAPAPAEPEPAEPAATPEEPAPLPSPKATRVVVQRAAEVSKQVLDAIEYDLKTPKAAVGEGSDGLGVDFVTGEGAMTPDDLDALAAKVDPEGKIAPHLKTAATMSALHGFYIEKGEPEKALQASAKYLLGVKGVTQTLGMLSMESAAEGDYEAACRLANDACNRFPSEHRITFKEDPKVGFTYLVEDAEGKAVEKGRLNPNQFLEVSAKIANGQAFTDQMFQFVSKHGAAGGNLGMAISNVGTAASRLAGIDQALAEIEEGDDGYEDLKAARKQAQEQLMAAERSAIELGGMTGDRKKRDTGDVVYMTNSIRDAKSAGMESPIPYEPPAKADEAVPTDDRNFWQRNMPGWLGGEEDPNAPAPAKAAIPTTAAPPAPAYSAAPAAPATSQGNPLPDAPRDATQRKAGTTYMTPKGPMIWRGTGWEPVK